MAEREADKRLSKDISLSSEEAEKLWNSLLNASGDVLWIPLARHLITKFRLNKAIQSNAFQFLAEPSEGVRDFAIQHNFDNLRKLVATQRPFKLIYPLICVDYIQRNVRDLKVLSIGPRTESEILTLLSVGFSNVTGVDLISYSKFIDVGDAHNLPYDDNSFDVIVMGWVLPYSSDNQRIADEILRVAKPKAHVAIGCVGEPEPDTPEKIQLAKNTIGGIPIPYEDNSRVVSRYFYSDQILNLFKGSIDHVIFRVDPYPEYKNEKTDVIAIFRLK